MAGQDQEKQKKNSRGKKRQEPVLLRIEPRLVYRGHLVWLSVKGKNFSRNTWQSLSVSGGHIEDQRFENDKLISLQVRINPGEHYGVLSISLTSNIEAKSPEISELTEISDEIAEKEVEIHASPVAGTTIVYIAGESSARPRLALGIAEVTNREYLEFLNYVAITGDHSACHPEEASDKSHVPDHWDDKLLRAPANPVTGLDWFDAYAYASWKGVRLPTADEWERAAGDDVFPWGDSPLQGYANTIETATMLVPSTSHRQGISPYGLAHMSGNAGEWTDAVGQRPGTAVLKGGSFQQGLLDARINMNNWADKLDRRIDIGFRIAVDLTDELWADKDASEEEYLATIRGIPLEPVDDTASDKTAEEADLSSKESTDEDDSKEETQETGGQRKKSGGKQRRKKKKKK